MKPTFLAVVTLLLSTVVQANEIRFSGKLSDNLSVSFQMVLKPKNFLCRIFSSKTVVATSEVKNGSYDLLASWNPGFCEYLTGDSTLSVKNSTGEITTLDMLIGASKEGWTDFRDINLLICADDPDLEQFNCTPIRADQSSVIGSHLYLDSQESSNYSLDILGQ